MLESVTHYLEKTLKLKVNRKKSGVGRPWQRKFLGYRVCNRRHNVRLRVDPKAVKRLRGDLKAIYRRGRGRSLGRIIEELNPKLRGWINYFRHIGVKSILEELDGWIRRHLRQVLWLQWKRSYSRAKNLMRLGLEEARAWNSAQNGRGPWWNAGASHLNRLSAEEAL